MSSRLVPKSVTLNDLERRSGRIFVISAKSAAFGAHCVNVVEYILKLPAADMQCKASSFYRYITYDDMMQRTALSGALNARGVAKYSDFGRIEGYISETMQHRK